MRFSNCMRFSLLSGSCAPRAGLASTSRARRLVAVCVLGGSLLASLATAVPVAASDAQSWTIVTTPDTSPTADNLLIGGSCVDAFNCWAVGLATPSFNKGGFHPLVENWNGSAWAIADSPEPPAGSNYVLLDTTCVSDSERLRRTGAAIGS